MYGALLGIAVNLHLLTAQPDMPGGYFHQNLCLSSTQQKNIFITDLPKRVFNFRKVKNNNGFASVTDNVGIGINPDQEFIKEFEVNE